MRRKERAVAVTTALNGVSREVQDTNYTVIRMALFGYSTVAICDATGLTPCQVSYRIRSYKLQKQRQRFRAAETAEAQTVLMDTALNVPQNVRNGELRKYDAIRQRILDAYKRGDL